MGKWASQVIGYCRKSRIKLLPKSSNNLKIIFQKILGNYFTNNDFNNEVQELIKDVSQITTEIASKFSRWKATSELEKIEQQSVSTY